MRQRGAMEPGWAVGRRGCWEGGSCRCRLRFLFWRKSHFSMVSPSKSPLEGYLLFLSLLCGVGPFWQTLTKKGGRVYREGWEVLPACPSQLLPTSLDKCQAPLGHRTCLASFALGLVSEEGHSKYQLLAGPMTATCCTKDKGRKGFGDKATFGVFSLPDNCVSL